jgi:hypothetical protein
VGVQFPFDTLTPARGHLRAGGSIRKFRLDRAGSLAARHHKPVLTEIASEHPDWLTFQVAALLAEQRPKDRNHLILTDIDVLRPTGASWPRAGITVLAAVRRTSMRPA